MEALVIFTTITILIFIIFGLFEMQFSKELLIIICFACIVDIISICFVIYGQNKGTTYIKYVTNNGKAHIGKMLLEKKECVANPYRMDDVCEVVDKVLIKNSDIENLFFQKQINKQENH